MIRTDGRPTIANARLCDFYVERHGSLFLVTPASTRGRDWLIEHVEPEAQWFGSALVVEGRYVYDLVDGIFDAGFTVQ